jgi:hypothetical protein
VSAGGTCGLFASHFWEEANAEAGLLEYDGGCSFAAFNPSLLERKFSEAQLHDEHNFPAPVVDPQSRT